MGPAINRRRFERFSLPPMYTPVSVRLLTEDRFSLEGHTYDICEGGAQFELDRGLEPGTPIALQITLPMSFSADEVEGPGRSIFVFGNVVWMDDSEPGPVRMAVVFSSFARQGDRERLLNSLTTRRLTRAA
ncbi:MAG: PilZ domain-containing protein [Phycisphaerales bacterium]|nr:PilZ domain-containing protein [Phycisphaerales bacterium]